MEIEMQNESERDLDNQMEYIVCCISDFAKRFNLKSYQVYPYLRRFGGIEYLLRHYNILHTLPFEDAVNDLINICKRNGGGLE